MRVDRHHVRSVIVGWTISILLLAAMAYARTLIAKR